MGVALCLPLKDATGGGAGRTTDRPPGADRVVAPVRD